MGPTRQAQNAIDKLKAAGFKRREFRVRTDRRYIGRHPDTGRQMFEYGDVSISLRAPKIRQFQLVRQMAEQGLHINLYQFEDGHLAYPHVYDVYWLKPGIYLEIAGQVNEYGLPIRRKL